MNTQDFRAAAMGGTRVSDLAAQEWERTYALFTHLTILTFHLLIPVLPALVMWLIKRDQSPFVDDHGREAVNFQISIFLYALLLAPIGVVTCSLGWWVGYPLLYVLAIVGMILAAIAANKGQFFRYPMTIRFLGR